MTFITHNASLQNHRKILETLEIEDDPIALQSLLSYTFNHSDDWKLEKWKTIYRIVSEDEIKDFIIQSKEVQRTVNVALKESGALNMVPPSTLTDMTRSLVNHRSLLLKSSVLKHKNEPWEEDGQSLKQFRKENGALGLPHAEEISAPGMFRSLISLAGRGISAIISNVTSSSSPNSDDAHDGDHGSQRYFITPERRLPYHEVMSLEPIPLETDVIVVDYLNILSQQFLHEVTQGSLRQHNVLVEAPHTSSNASCVVLPLLCVVKFLESNLGKSPTSDHIAIFIWSLSFLSNTNCRPFEFNFGLNDTISKFKALKICSDEEMSEYSTEITANDKAAVLEKYAEDFLMEKLNGYKERAAVADIECKKQLAQKQQEAALRWLKRKKFCEQQIDALQQQILKVDEARQMRDSTISVGLVANVLQVAVQATKAAASTTNGGVHQRVSELMEEFNQSKEDVQKAQDYFEQKANADISSDSLEKEYSELLMVQQVDDILEDLIIPTHPLPGPHEVEPKTIPTRRPVVAKAISITTQNES